MKKKIFTILCSISLCIFSLFGLTACNLIEIDKVAYYTQEVVYAGDYVFTKKELIDAFNNYGYSYYQNGNSLEDSVKYSAEVMVKRKLLIEHVKEFIDITNFKLNENDQPRDFTDEIRYNTFKTIQENLESIEETIIEELGQTPLFPDAETVSKLRSEKEEYTPAVKLENDNTVKFLVEELEPFNEVVPQNFVPIKAHGAISDEAWVRYIKGLQQTAKREGRSTSESDVLKYEYDRLIKILTENKYLELFELKYKNNQFIDTNIVVDYFKEQYLAQYAQFNSNMSEYHEAMKNSSSNFIYYHPNSGQEYLYVNHILIKFSEAQVEEIALLDARKENDPVWAKNYYQEQKEAIIQATQSTYEEDGEVYTSYAYDIFNRICDYVDGGINFEEKAKRFEDMIYIFNDDTGNMNADFYYTVNIDTNVTDQMVPEFANASRELFYDFAKGDIYPVPVATEYGLHIMFYAGGVENIISDKANLDGMDYLTLFNHKVNPTSEKTLFHYLYDKIAKDNYSEYSDNLIKQVLGEYEVKYLEYRYKDLWSK